MVEEVGASFIGPEEEGERPCVYLSVSACFDERIPLEARIPS